MSLNDVLSGLLPWEPSWPMLAIAAVSAGCYLKGSAKVHTPAVVRFWFWLGWLFIYGALQTKFDYYSQHAFFMHRLQHALLHHTGPFFIALSRPGEALAAGTPVRIRRWIRGALDAEPIAGIIDRLNRPAVAGTLFCGLIIFWLIPHVHFIAMLDWRCYELMNGCMLADGLMFWNLAMNGYALRPAPASASRRSVMMLAVVPPQIVAGALLFIATREIYTVYSICGRVFVSLSALDDQQLGGIVLWNSAMMSVIGILILLRKGWMIREAPEVFSRECS